MLTSRPQRDLLVAVGTLALSALTSAACESEELFGLSDGFTDHEWAQIRAMEPLAYEAPDNPANALAKDDAAARLGQMLFFDAEFSTAVKVDGPSGTKGQTGKVSCVTCHDPNKYFIDSRTTEGSSHGVDFTGRTSPSTVNLGWYEWITWAGRLDSLSMQGANAPEAGTDVNTSRLFFAHLVYAKYREEWNAVFPYHQLPAELDPNHPAAARFPPAGKPKAAMTDPDGPWEMMAPEDRTTINWIMANAGKAIEAYERKLVTPNSRFEQYVRGARDAITAQEKRGLRLFVGRAACAACHTGPILSDNKFHNVGVPQAAPRIPATDHGRFQDLPKLLGNPFNGQSMFSDSPGEGMAKLDAVRMAELDPVTGAPLESTRGQFRTPSLLNIAETAPYFHNGSARTLEEVIEYYDRGGGDPGTYSGAKAVRMVPLGLTAAEKADLIAFLKTLTGEHPPSEWRMNTAKPPLPPATTP